MTEKINIFEPNWSEVGNLTVRKMPKYQRCFLGYIDILGYKNLILTLGENAPEQIGNIFLTSVDWSKSSYKHIKLSLLSDAVILTSHSDHPAEFFNLHNVAQQVCRSLLMSNLLSRGAIVVGNHSQDNDRIVSPALIEAYKLEQSADMPRILLSNELCAEVQSSMKKVEGAPHLDVVYHPDGNRLIDRDIFSTDEEDGRVIVDFYAGEPFFCLRKHKTMNHWPGDKEPSEDDLRVFYDQAIQHLENYRSLFQVGLKKSKSDSRHYRKWHYMARKFDHFLKSASHLSYIEKDRLSICDKL